MSTLRFVQTPACALYTSISGAATSVRITPYPVDLDGNKLTITDFGSTPTCTLDPKIDGSEEIASFTGIVDNGDDTATLTGLTRDLTSKYPYTTAGVGKAHGSSAVVVFSDNPQMYGRLAAKENDEAITGSWTFPTPVDPANPARLSDLNAVVAGTVPSASSQVQGSTKLSKDPSLSLGTATITVASPGVVSLASHGLIAGDQVKFTTTGALPTGLTVGVVYYVISAGLTSGAFEVAATLGGTAINTSGSQSGVHTLFRVTPFAVADNDPRVPQNAYGASAAGTDTYAITLGTAPAAYVTGQEFTFKADVANTGAATLNVNGLGAKTIKKNVSSDLATGDIAIGQIVLVKYDGTNFQLLSKSSLTQTVVTSHTYNSGTANKDLAEASATVQLIPHGLGVIPTRIRIRYAVGTTNMYLTDGTWQNAKYSRVSVNIPQAAGAVILSTGEIVVLPLSAATIADLQTAVVTSVDATNITLTWTKVGTPSGTVTFLWEAEGDITATGAV